MLSFSYTLKTPGSEIDPERVHWGHTPFRVNNDPEISQLDAECDPELGQSDPIICQVCRNLTNFRVIFDPEWSLAPMDPFPGHADPGVLRVYGVPTQVVYELGVGGGGGGGGGGVGGRAAARVLLVS